MCNVLLQPGFIKCKFLLPSIKGTSFASLGASPSPHVWKRICLPFPVCIVDTTESEQCPDSPWKVAVVVPYDVELRKAIFGWYGAAYYVSRNCELRI